MRRLVIVILLLLLIYYLAQYILSQIFINGLPAMVVFAGTNPSELEERIISHYRENLIPENSKLTVGEYRITSEYEDLNGDGKNDLIVTVHSNQTCAHERCLTTIFLYSKTRSFEPIEFFELTNQIKPLETSTNDMRDLEIDNAHIMKWDGIRYVREAI